MKIANIDGENLHIMWLSKILKVAKNQGFTLSLENTFLEKQQGGSIWHPSPHPKTFKG